MIQNFPLYILNIIIFVKNHFIAFTKEIEVAFIFSCLQDDDLRSSTIDLIHQNHSTYVVV